MKIPNWFRKWYHQYSEPHDQVSGYHGLRIAWRAYRKGKGAGYSEILLEMLK